MNGPMNTPLNTQLQARLQPVLSWWGERNLRERMLVLASATAAVLVAGDALLTAPLERRLKSHSVQLQDQQAQLDKLRADSGAGAGAQQQRALAARLQQRVQAATAATQNLRQQAADAARLLQMGDEVTGLRLALTDMYAAPRIVHDAALALGGGFYVEDWTTQHANFFRSIEITKRILFVILSLVVAVAAFNIVSTMVMVVKDKRRDMLRAYAEGRFQFLVNVDVATEGFDEPGIQLVVMARPTKSRAKYAQMAGRGTSRSVAILRTTTEVLTTPVRLRD